MNKENNYGLEINNEVVTKMASVAVLEVEGVAGLVTKPVDIKGVFAKSESSRAIRVNKTAESTELDIYISIKHGTDVRAVAEKVQTNVKSKLQNMTGNAIEKVNVYIADVDFNLDDNKE